MNLQAAPRVSVLMSNYNTNPEYLVIAIESVLQQTFEDFEIVMINDGSTDVSFDTLKSYAEKDSRFRLIENPCNLGLAPSLNRGLKECRGEYIARLDTDDICYPDRLQRQVEYMDVHPSMILSGGWADVFEDDENRIVQTWQPRMCSSTEEYRIHLLFGNSPLMIHPSVMYRRALLEAKGIEYDTDPAYRYAEDYRMWTLCADAGEVGILEHPLIKYRNEVCEDRITIRHAKEMDECSYHVQKELYQRLGIDLTKDQYTLNNGMLLGRKEYSEDYLNWIKAVISANKKYGIYNRELLQSILMDKWYNITYYGIAYEKSMVNRLKYFFRLPFGYKVKFIKEAVFHAK